jgi:hypothetical protein
MRTSQRLPLALALLWLAGGAVAGAQERLVSSGPEQTTPPGWTITPTLGVAEIYDDNIALFGAGSADKDSIANIAPQIDLAYAGKHTTFDTSYSGSFLDYHTFSSLNRWNQRIGLDLKRQESARLKWAAAGGYAVLPSTDLVEFGGVPFSLNGVRTSDGSAQVTYDLDARDSIGASLLYQSIDFDRTAAEATEGILLGGEVEETKGMYRRKVDQRVALGADYAFRRSLVHRDSEVFSIHTTQAALDVDLAPGWTLTAGGGVVHLQSTLMSLARTGPAVRASLDRRSEHQQLHVGYLRTYVASFGFGGSMQEQEVGASLATLLFRSRHWYTTQSVVWRDTQPLTDIMRQLPLRSVRTYSALGWSPQPWVRFEGFYARTYQSPLRPGSEIERNQIGIQIVTSKPVRME